MAATTGHDLTLSCAAQCPPQMLALTLFSSHLLPAQRCVLCRSLSVPQTLCPLCTRFNVPVLRLFRMACPGAGLLNVQWHNRSLSTSGATALLCSCPPSLLHSLQEPQNTRKMLAIDIIRSCRVPTTQSRMLVQLIPLLAQELPLWCQNQSMFAHVHRTVKRATSAGSLCCHAENWTLHRSSTKIQKIIHLIKACRGQTEKLRGS